MDAAWDTLERKKLELLSQVVEIELAQQRQRGLFDKVPHFSQIEEIGGKLGRLVSRSAQNRLASEVAAGEPAQRPCPTCGGACRVQSARRTVSGIDGPLTLLEPKAYCSACRRAFFPAA